LCGNRTTKEDQLPEKAKRFLEKGSFDWLASEPELIEAAKSGEDISPVAYPHAATDLREAINRSAGLTDKDVLVAGSISPWIESIVKMYSPRSITTSDYTERRIRSNLTKFVKVESLHSIQAKFDVVLSFSSIEHDGLGRYCDPINPDGDKAAMKEFHQLLRPGGMLFLGVPVDGSLTKTHVENNQQRIYSRDSFEELACGFDNIQIVNTHYGFSACTPTNCKRGAWQNQPRFILHKGNHSA
jgi:SAM-dependent methyltransferase